MANESVAVANAPANVANNSPTVMLFQKAHAKMVTLQRVDEQLQSLLEQRKKLQEELRGVQGLINDEFDRVMKDAQEAPARLLAQFGENPKGKRNGSAVKDAIRLEVAEAM